MDDGREGRVVTGGCVPVPRFRRGGRADGGAGARLGRGRESATNEREGESEGEGRRERSSWCSSRGRARRARCEREVGRRTASDGIIIIIVIVNVVRRLDDERER